MKFLGCAPCLDPGDGKLAGYALWGLMAASTALNAWGWAQSTPAIVALVLTALVIASEVMGMSLAERVAVLFGERAAAPVRFAAGVALFVGVVAFNAYSGHRALEAVETQRREPFEAASSAHNAAAERVERLQREMESARMSVAAIPADIPGSRIEILQRPHRETMRGLEPDLIDAEADLRATPAPAEPPAPMQGAVMWAIVALIEALKAFGRWAIGNAGASRAVAAAQVIGATGKRLIEELFAAGKITRSDVASFHAGARWRQTSAR